MAKDDEADLRERALAGDVDAAFELGRRAWSHDVLQGDAWFRAAVAAGDIKVMYRVVEHVENNPPSESALVGVWKRRAGIASFPRVDAPHIWVALSTFAGLDNSGRAYMEPDRSLVVQADDIEAARSAVDGAIAGLRASGQPVDPGLFVDESGVMLTFAAKTSFAERRTVLDTIISALRGAGIRAAYIRPQSAEPWLPTGVEPDPEFSNDIAGAALRAIEQSDPEAAFTVGSWCQDNAYRHCGDVWFKKAAAHSGLPMLLRIVDAYATRYLDWNGDRFTGWMARLWRIEYPRVDAPGIHVREDVLAPIVMDDCAGYGHHTEIQVLSAQPDVAAQALRAASIAFTRTTLDGRVFPTDEALDAAEPDGDDSDAWANYYTPNFVSDVEFDGPHPHIWMDWKDNTAPRMARAVIHRLIDELNAHGIRNAVIRRRPTQPTDH